MVLINNYAKKISSFIKYKDNEITFPWGAITDLRQIGQGGSGLVYSGKYNDNDVILKFFYKNSSSNDFERFKNEYFNIQLLENAEKTHLASYINFDSIEIEDDLFFLYIMKRYKSTLKDYVLVYTGDKSELCEKVLYFLLKSLKQIHSKDIIHRDLKPENILVDCNDKFYLSDFGIAKYCDNSMTKVGDRLANYKFSAPEQSEKGTPITKSADIFALGQLIFWLLEGHTYAGTLDIDEYENNLIKPLLIKCLKYNVEERFQSIEEIEEFIEAEKRRLARIESMHQSELIYEKRLEANRLFTDLIRHSYPNSHSHISVIESEAYFNRVLTDLNAFINKYIGRIDIWYSTGWSNQILKNINYDVESNIVQLMLKDLNLVLEFSLEQIWLYADVSDYTSLYILKIKNLEPYEINDKKTYYKSIVNGEIEVDTNDIRSGYLELGETNGVIRGDTHIDFERYNGEDQYIAIGPLFLGAVYHRNEDFLHDLQDVDLTEEVVKGFIKNIRSHKLEIV